MHEYTVIYAYLYNVAQTSEMGRQCCAVHVLNYACDLMLLINMRRGIFFLFF